ncbi:Parathyroid hormone 2 receptor, partial [Bulinus truncatus]
DHADRIKIMYSVGYGVSLIALAVAIFIMIYFRRLHCPRNTIHLNLFMAFVLRALLSFLKDSLHDIHLGQSDEVEEFAPGRWRYYRLSGSLTSSAWVFIEGLYLYVLVTVTIFSERRYIRWCTLLGWAGPFLFLVPWVIIRATLEDDLLKDGILGRERREGWLARRLGKSTLVLIPIFGVHYLVTIGVPDNINPEMETVKLYFEMFFNSFQVQTEIRKRYIRHKLRVNSRKFHNKYVTTASSQVRPRTCPSCSPRHESRFRYQTFKKVFTGTALCDWLIRVGLTSDRSEAVAYGRHLVLGRFVSICVTERIHSFTTADKIYREKKQF